MAMARRLKSKTQTKTAKPKARVPMPKKTTAKKSSKKTPARAKTAAQKSAKTKTPQRPQTIRIKLKLPKQVSLPWRDGLPGETLAGVVEDYLGHQNVMITTPHHPLKVGDVLHIRGCTTNLTHPIASIQCNHVSITQAQAGQQVGIQLSEKVRKNDYIYLVIARP